jgi:membrane fusion protein (multidrug efflux system)
MAEEEKEKEAPARSNRWRLIGIAAAVLVLVAAVFWWRSRSRESTDDAQIDGHITQIAPRVAGPVVKVPVDNNIRVKAGDLLVQIDPRDYQVAVARAKAELADAQANAMAATTGVPVARVETRAGVSTASGGVEEAEAAVRGAEQQIASARANLLAAQSRQTEKESAATKAEHDVERFKSLAAKDEIPQQQFDAAVSTAAGARAAADAAKSDVAAAQAAIGVAEERARQARGSAAQAQASLASAKTAPQQLQITQARAASAEARVKQAQAALEQAELNLQYTTIKAPSDGVVSRKTVEVGQVVQTGQPLLALVSMTDVWVTANFKETQLRLMRPGQSVVVEVDGLGGKEFKGTVDSIAAATGAKFSLLPPENATGNYVKVVQRVPVKIVFEPGQDPDRLLRPGMSVTPIVYVR